MDTRDSHMGRIMSPGTFNLHPAAAGDCAEQLPRLMQKALDDGRW